MTLDEAGAEFGKLAIEHFENPKGNAEKAIQKILEETPLKDMSSLLKKANEHSGKVSILPEYDKCGMLNQVNVTFHPLWSWRPLAKDMTFPLHVTAECQTEKVQKNR